MRPQTTRGHTHGLVALARIRFGDLSAAEMKLLKAAPKGEFAVCGPNRDKNDPANDPAKADEWGADRVIRAELIRWLCVDDTAREQVDAKGIRVLGARVVGKLDLSYATVPFGLALGWCRLMEDAEFDSAGLRELTLGGTWVCSLGANGITVKGSVLLRNGFRAEGEVRLIGAQIGRDLNCENSVLTNPSGVALLADGISVKGGVFLREGFQAEGEVRLLDAEIGTTLDCGKGVFMNPSGVALYADRISVKGTVFLRDGFQADGEVRFLGAQVGSDFACGNNSVLTNPSGVALYADGIGVKGNVFLRNSFRAEGEVRLLGAEVGATLDCGKGVFMNPSRVALNADRISVRGTVFLRDGFQADGEVRLLGGQIGGNLACDNGVFSNASKVALYADLISVNGGVFLREGFQAEGEVRLLGAEIGTLVCANGEFTNPSKDALSADRISVNGIVLLGDGFRAQGAVRLQGAQVEGDLDCGNSAFTTPPKEGIDRGGSLPGQLDARGSIIKGALFWIGIANSAQVQLDLRTATVGSFVDDGDKSWPSPGNLFLDGFVYGRFSGGPRSARERLEWLSRLNLFTPQPYQQLARVLKDEGDDDGARLVLFEMERLRRQKEDRGRIVRLWSGILRLTIGFGYYPGRSLLWLLGLAVLSTILTWGGYAAGSIAPADKEAYGTFRESNQVPLHYERFHASVYALENSFPLVKLGQVERWQPEPNPQWKCRSPKHFSRLLCWVLSPTVLRWFRWGQICLGWFFTTMFVAGVTGIVRKD